MSALYLIEDFAQDYDFIYANTDQLKHQAYILRSRSHENIMDIDQYDTHSHHILLKHKTTNTYAACARIIEPPAKNPDKLLPFEENHRDNIWASRIAIKDLSRRSFSELSRINIAPAFHPEETDLNQIPQILLGLYLASISLARLLFHDYIFVELPEISFKKLRVHGLLFEQASNSENDHDNTMYCLNLESGISSASPIYELHQHILNEMAHQLNIPIVQDNDIDEIHSA